MLQLHVVLELIIGPALFAIFSYEARKLINLVANRR